MYIGMGRKSFHSTNKCVTITAKVCMNFIGTVLKHSAI